jgi:hypothetical protein
MSESDSDRVEQSSSPACGSFDERKEERWNGRFLLCLHHGQQSGNQVPCRVVRLTFSRAFSVTAKAGQSDSPVSNVAQQFSVRQPSKRAAGRFVTPAKPATPSSRAGKKESFLTPRQPISHPHATLNFHFPMTSSALHKTTTTYVPNDVGRGQMQCHFTDLGACQS